MSDDEPVELIVSVAAATRAEWFVVYESGGARHEEKSTVGQAITLPAGAKIIDYGPVVRPTLNLGHSIKVLPDGDHAG